MIKSKKEGIETMFGSWKKAIHTLLASFIVFSLLTPTIHVEAAGFTLTATPHGAQDYISLSWTKPTSDQNYTYQLYQKKPESSEFQTIPAKSTAKVLNVYPNVGEMISFTTYYGQQYTLPKAASLKMWMETPNPDHPKGYGKGLISVDPVTLADFNSNPSLYLKNPDGSWKYDVVFFGSWDCNGDCRENGDISVEAKNLLDEFIETGRGVLFGHDTLHGAHQGHPNFAYFRTRLNLKLQNFDPIDSIPYVSSDEILIKKKGLLTNYPWQIGEIGSTLKIPYAHTSSQIALGDVWMEFTNYEGRFDQWTGPEMKDPQTGTGTNGYYLTTWNNLAMIQTGHSKGEATPDEQKVLANTLFYLSQITDQNSWDDHSGQDVAAPNQPGEPTVDVQNGIVTIEIPPVTDNGSQYEYYVEATGHNGVKYTSNIVSVTITSGIKGYSIVIDQNPDTVPDSVVETTGTTYQTTLGFKGPFYVHIAAIDNAGNKSPVTHVQYSESVYPIMNYSLSTTEPTNQDVQIQVSASDSSMGVKRIKKVDIRTNGLKGVYYTHPADPSNKPPTTKNGAVFERIDPVVDFDWGSDSPDPSKLAGDYFTVEWTGLVYAPVSGTYTFQTITDDGSRLDVNGVRIIDKWIQQGATAHTGTIDLEGGKWYSIKFSHYENSGAAVAKLLWQHSGTNGFEVIPSQYLAVIDNDGWIDSDSIIYSASDNGAYVFVAEDYFGNIQAITVIINNIDKIPPQSPTVKDEGDRIEIITPEPGSTIVYRVNGSEWKPYKNGVLDNLNDGHYVIEIKAIDQAGNESSIIRIVKDVYKKALANVEFLFRYAEIYKRDPHLSNVLAAINNLPESAPEKAEYLNRYNALILQIEEEQFAEAYKNALNALEKAEKYKREPYLSKANEQIEQLPNRTEKSDLLVRYQDLLAQIEEENFYKAYEKAVATLEKAEKYKREPYVSNAKEQIDQLPDRVEKSDLLNRYNQLLLLIEGENFAKAYESAVKDLEKAEKYKREPYLSKAREQIDSLPNRPEKQQLMERWNILFEEVQQELEREAFEKAIQYVSYAERYKSSYYIKKAQEYVQALPDSPEKRELEERLRQIQ